MSHPLSENSKAQQRGAVLDVLLEQGVLVDEGDLDPWAVERIRAVVVEPDNDTSGVADQLDAEALGMAGDLHGVADALIARLRPTASR